MIDDKEDDPDFRVDLAEFEKMNEVVQVQVSGRDLWTWCVRRAGVEVRRGVRRRQLSDDELLALLHSIAN